jgi:hypothetical protein
MGADRAKAVTSGVRGAGREKDSAERKKGFESLITL